MRLVTYGLEAPNVLVKEGSVNYPALSKLKMPHEVAQVMMDVYRLDRMAEEHAYMVAVNAKQKPLGVFKISHGSIDATFLGAREIYTRALLIGACSIIVCHNHPSGDPSPSGEDIAATGEIQKAGELVGVALLDHVIVCSGTYYSFLEDGKLGKKERGASWRR